MAIRTQVLFQQPQHEVASLLRKYLASCVSVSIVSGFATIEGVDAIFPSIHANIGKLQSLVVGAGTYRAYEAFDELLQAGVAPDRLKVHLGHSRSTGSGAKHSFYRYHPMLHSKVYLMEMGDGDACAFIGSHNLTGFAMHGLNGEAGVLLEGSSDSPEFKAIRGHIKECITQSVQYSPDMKEALSWWTVQFLEGLRDRANDAPRDGEAQRTIVVLAVASDDVPKKDDTIYFEIPAAIGQIESMRAEVHVYIFPVKPTSARHALSSLSSATHSLWCQTLGLEKERGGVELLADWHISGNTDPRLLRTKKPFRPRPVSGMQQVRVKVRNEVFENFDYLFQGAKATWEPVFSGERTIRAPKQELSRLASLKLVPPEDKEWQLVVGLSPTEPDQNGAYKEALRLFSPDGEGFILVSLRRRKQKG